MKPLFAVTLTKGSGWDANEQMHPHAYWDAHAALMDRWAADGFILLGGLIGEGDDEVLLVFNATDENETRSAFAVDPWLTLQIREIRKFARGRFS